MKTESKPIKGQEIWTESAHAEKELSLFYKAFNSRSMPLMEQSWLMGDEISMDNPIGGIRRGWDEIKKGYERIFNGKAEVYVEFYDYTIDKTESMLFATGRERGYFKSGQTEIALAIRTTRIFVLQLGEWKQIHHHGSIDDPQMLEQYQKAMQI